MKSSIWTLCLVGLAIGTLAAAAAAQTWDDLTAEERAAATERRRAETREDFESQGLLPGERVEKLRVMNMEGEDMELAALWEEKPTLLVTASLTCGRARERQEWVERLAEKYGDDLNVAVLYTVEAHPVRDPSPYAEYSPELEDPSRPGERARGAVRAGLPRRQPTTVEERRALAEEFKELAGVSVPLLLDRMDNEAWKAFGGGPNVGLLVRPDGTIEVKHGWFDGETMDRSIEYFLETVGEEGD
jgi:hypothetical protein